MKRRDFVKSTTLTALGATLINPLASVAEPVVTHLESEDISPSASIKDDYNLHFMAVGDWGRNAEYDQPEVANQMGIWAKTHPNDFVISAGDNFYPKGVVSEHDPLWNYSFESVYTAHSLQCDWYPILGNHDYHSDPDAQIRYSKISRRWNMPARYYSKEMELSKGGEKVLFVMIDTDPILFEDKKEYVDKQFVWIDQTLKNASANVKWTIIVGHHPAYTVGPRITNYDTLTARKILTPLFARHKIDLYLSGHDHSLQHLKADGFPHQFITGAGSELTPVTAGVPYAKFQDSTHGFMYFSVDNKRLNVKAIDTTGKILYETELTK